MLDDTKPSFTILGTTSAQLTISLSDVKPTLFASKENTIDLTIPLSDKLPQLIQAQTIYPHLDSITDIKIPAGTVTPPVGGSQTNFAIGWWLYVNDQPFVPNNTNFGPGWFMYTNSR